jgi:sugar/nucleoside kinase (ribokinase family)
MVMTTLNGILIRQDPATTQSARPVTKAEAKAAATAAADAQRAADKAFGNQIRDQVRAQIAGAAAQGAPVAPTPPESRQFTIRGPNGEQTIIGMPPASDIIPPQAVDISVAFFMTIAIIIIGLPLARAFARRLDRKGASPQISTDVSAQLAQLNQSVDAIALEVERITEGQRFTTRLLTEQRDAARQALPSSADR